MTLVEKSIVTHDNELFSILDNLCFLSKNLYNSSLYQLRQHFFKNEKLDYGKLDKMFRNESQVDYKALPQKVSQHIIKLACQSFSSFYALLKKKKKNEYSEKVRIPKYLDKTNGRQVIFYTNQAISIKNLKTDGFFTLSKVHNFNNELIKFYTNVDNIQFVRIVPKGNHIVIEVGYRVDEKHFKKYNKIASIDLGLNNLATVTTNFSKPFIINGKPLKYINNECNKQIVKLKKSNYYCHNIEYRWTNRMYAVLSKRENRINDYLHKASRSIVTYLVSNQIDTLVIGKNNGWKQNINLGRVNNQNFVQIPFNRFIDMLSYKCILEGIRCLLIEENHTSKCSFIDNESVEHHDKYLGIRKTRDLFYTKNNICINADVNGSYNIMKRWCQTNNSPEYISKKLSKYNICQNPKKITINANSKNVI